MQKAAKKTASKSAGKAIKKTARKAVKVVAKKASQKTARITAGKGNLCYAQSGGVTAVINVTAAAVLQTAMRSPAIGRVYAAKNGILGALNEELFEVWREKSSELDKLAQTPGGAFGSCRVKLPSPQKDAAPFARLFDVFRTHNIRYFLYNGGNDSADTAMKLSAAAKMFDWPLITVGIPKTIDNDLAQTDACPGFASAAKYIAVSVAETMRDVAAMARTSTKVFILEVMGRHAGWLAAAGGMAAVDANSPIMILPPEERFESAHFMAVLRRRIKSAGFAVVVVSEGLCDAQGRLISAGESDAFLHKQLGGVAPMLADLVRQDGFKCHWAVADYLQRAARHLASAMDVRQAKSLGVAAVKMAVSGDNAMAPVIQRLADSPYRWRVAKVPLQLLANQERKLPRHFYRRENYMITEACRRYLRPLIAGEDYPSYDKNGLPQFAALKNIQTRRLLPPYRH